MHEQLNQMQSMLEQLITMVGSNNAAIEELRQDVTELRQDVTGLRYDVDSANASIAGLSQDVAELRQDVTDIKAVMATKNDVERLALAGQEDVIALLRLVDSKTDKLDDKFDAVNERLFSQETQLQRLKKLAHYPVRSSLDEVLVK